MRSANRHVKPMGAEDAPSRGALPCPPLRCKSSVRKDAAAAPQRGCERLMRSKSSGSERNCFANLNVTERHMMVGRRSEREYSGLYCNFASVNGAFRCHACGIHLYSAHAKLDGRTGLPTFDR